MFLYTTMIASMSDGGTATLSTQTTGWMERQGDHLFSTLIAKDMTADSQFKLSVFHKARETAGDGTSAASDTITTDGSLQLEASGLLELVRYEVEFSYTGSANGTTVHGLQRLLAPQWQWTGA